MHETHINKQARPAVWVAGQFSFKVFMKVLAFLFIAT